MKGRHRVVGLILALELMTVAALGASADSIDNSQITPTVTIAPTLFPVGKVSSAFACIANGNPSSAKSIQGGDVFRLTFDGTIGVVTSVSPQVLVNSSSLNSSDFVASLGAAPNEIVISYLGASKRWVPGDGFCVRVTLAASNAIGSGKVTAEAPVAVGRFNNIDPSFTTISVVDFPTGPPGPAGPGSVTSVSASSPLVVSSPTTTPNISLGIVPAVNGGTGLASPGASGSFLRSTGIGWISSPLTAADIPGGSSLYLQNTTSRQPGANFNISGNGVAGIFDAATQYNIGGARILSNPGAANLFAGIGAGAANAGQSNAFFGNSAGLANVNGDFNSFFGSGAGKANTNGDNNSFFGSNAGAANTTGFQNSFYGREAGVNNTEGSFNSFFGRSTGLLNTTGLANSFFGQNAGLLNTTGGLNAFYGNSAGQGNDTGSNNSFFGMQAGQNNSTGSNNTAIGSFADVGANNLTFATAIGSGAIVNTSNTLTLGRSADIVQVPGSLNVSQAINVAGGNVLVGSAGKGIVLKSPDGSTCRVLAIDNTGNITLMPVACP